MKDPHRAVKEFNPIEYLKTNKTGIIHPKKILAKEKIS